MSLARLPCLAIFFTAAVFLFSGCATTRVAEADLAKIKSVSVVANVNDSFVAKKVGTTAFNNAQYALPALSSDRNATVAKLVGDAIAGSRVQVVSIDQSHPAFRTVKPELDFWTGKEITNIQPVLNAVKSQQAVDAVLLITSGQMQDPFTGTNQFFEGQGFYHRAFLNLKQSQVFVIISGHLYDARDGRSLGRRSTSGIAPVNVDWRKDGESFTAEELAAIRVGFDEALASAVSELVQKIGFNSDK